MKLVEQAFAKAIMDNVEAYLQTGDVTRLQANEAVWKQVTEAGLYNAVDEILQEIALKEMAEAVEKTSANRRRT